MTIDLRSDTVTRPTPGMLEAMFSAKVGDDVFDEDPTVSELESKAAAMFAKEAGLFCVSGTMTNQIAIKLHTQPGDELICDKTSHVYLYEGGGIAFNSGVSVRLAEGDRGRLSPSQIADNINPDNIHNPVTSLVSVENTHNRGGGSYYTLGQINGIRNICREKGLKLHLDGARLFNALVETGDDYRAFGENFDTISLCLSKGLGIPVGSVLVGSREHIRKARRIRKVFGGGWRQAGYLAAAGIYALDNHIARLKDDHIRAGIIGKALSGLECVEELFPVDTNIVVFRLRDDLPVGTYLQKLEEQGVKAVQFGPQQVRMVTHLDFTDDMLTTLLSALKKVNAGLKAVA
jgi:threonine aldolase